MKTSSPVGIVGWGAYIPRYRIKSSEIARVWGKDPKAIENGIRIIEKAVPGLDEDTGTISVEAAKNALNRTNIPATNIGAVFVGTESPPYAVKPTGITVAAAIGAGPSLLAADFEFACKAGTEALQCVMGLVGSGMIEYGLAIGADTAQGRPGDALEYSAAGGGAAYIVGRNEEEWAAEIECSYSYTTDTPDFWRRPHETYPRHAEAFTGQPAYFHHVVSAAKGLMEDHGLGPQKFKYIVLHQPNGKFPVRASKTLGFTSEQLGPGLLSPVIGNTYAGATPLGLAACLDVLKPGERILAVSYGSGAGSDAFCIRATEQILKKQSLAPTVKDYVSRKTYVDYALYARYRGKILK
ncbi:MAG: hydroxymethylglutaryl-CoA synthase [Candidatus Ranarchaeia archaeon]